MKNIKTNIDIKIENGVNKVYGIDKLNDADRKKADRTINKLAFRKLKEDNAKAKFAKFIKTETGAKFINKLDIIALKPLCDQFHLGYLLLWKDYNAVRAIIDEIMSELKIEKPVISHPKDYGTWSRDMFHALPKNLTTKKTKVKTVGYNFYGQDPSLPFWKRVSTTKIVPSEVGAFNEMYTKLRYERQQEYLDALLEHKIQKWITKNPKPDTTGDLFPKELEAAWSAREHNARCAFKKLIEDKYTKRTVVITGRFHGNSTDEFNETKIVSFSGSKKDTDDILSKSYKDNKVIVKSMNILKQVKENNNKLICGFIKIEQTGKGRTLILLSKAAQLHLLSQFKRGLDRNIQPLKKSLIVWY